MELSNLKKFLERTGWEKTGSRRYRKGTIEILISSTDQTIVISEYDSRTDTTVYLPPIDIASIIYFDDN